eukprot:8877048-Pyramimonas_sp.AAC.1
MEEDQREEVEYPRAVYCHHLDVAVYEYDKTQHSPRRVEAGSSPDPRPAPPPLLIRSKIGIPLILMQGRPLLSASSHGTLGFAEEVVEEKHMEEEEEVEEDPRAGCGHFDHA